MCTILTPTRKMETATTETTATDANAAAAAAPLRVLVCIPGRTFSNRFLMAWSNFMAYCFQTGRYQLRISNEYSSYVPFARARCLGAAVDRGAHQKPFNGQLDYDVQLWIDSDIVFTVEQAVELIESTQQYPVVSGIYMMEGGRQFAAVRHWDTDHFAKHATYEFLTPDAVQAYLLSQEGQASNGVLPCAYAGMGFMAIRRGVIEQLPYPWFVHDLYRIPTASMLTPDMVDCCSEDVALCRNLIEKGIIPYIAVKLNLRVGHEKTVVL
jgi:hypothetical protein